MQERTKGGWPAVMAMLGPDAPSERTLRRMIKAGKFPRPFRVSTRRVLFDMKEIADWIEHTRDEKGGAA